MRVRGPVTVLAALVLGGLVPAAMAGAKPAAGATVVSGSFVVQAGPGLDAPLSVEAVAGPGGAVGTIVQGTADGSRTIDVTCVDVISPDPGDALVSVGGTIASGSYTGYSLVFFFSWDGSGSTPEIHYGGFGVGDSPRCDAAMGAIPDLVVSGRLLVGPGIIDFRR